MGDDARKPGDGGRRDGGDDAGGAGPSQWVSVFERLFAPHPSHVALMGLDGTVLAVNAAWQDYGRMNGLPASYECVGQNYLSVCEAGVAAGSESAREAYVGLLGVLRGGRPKFTLVYPCHTPRQREWYRMWVEPQSPSVPAVIVAHQLVSARPWVAGEDAAGGAGHWSGGSGSGRLDAWGPPSTARFRD